MARNKQRVVVVGASASPERYSNRAVRLLLQSGHDVVPVHPTEKMIEGIPVSARLADVTGHVDTITLYVGEKISTQLQSAIVGLRPNRVV